MNCNKNSSPRMSITNFPIRRLLKWLERSRYQKEKVRGRLGHAQNPCGWLVTYQRWGRATQDNEPATIVIIDQRPKIAYRVLSWPLCYDVFPVVCVALKRRKQTLMMSILLERMHFESPACAKLTKMDWEGL